MTIKDAWDYIYGEKSHMNAAGKILVGTPLFPFVIIFVGTWLILDLLFSRKGDQNEI
jgi:hypothetical protein